MINPRYRPNNLNQSHAAALSDIRYIPEFPLWRLMEMVIPSQLSSRDLDAILGELEQQGCIQQNEWTVFKRAPSAASELRQQDYFEHRLPELHRSVVRIAKRVCSARLSSTADVIDLKMTGSSTRYNKRENTSRPDGYYCMRERQGSQVDWDSIAVPIEVKKRSTQGGVHDVYMSYHDHQSRTLHYRDLQNLGKILWSMHQIMRSDARRLSTMGITIEDLSLRLWHCDRASALVSRPIHIHEVWHFFPEGMVIYRISFVRTEES